MIFLDSTATSEESNDEDNDSNDDQDNRSRCVEVLICQVYVGRGVDLGLDAHDQDYETSDLEIVNVIR